MNRVLFFALFFLQTLIFYGQEGNSFKWGESVYINLNIGEKTTFNQTELQLISVYNQFNTIRIGQDTFVLKVSRRTLPVSYDKIKVFVADNKFLKNVSANQDVHGLLKKDVLLCLSDFNKHLLDPILYKFPVDFTDGFQWSAEEERQIFAFLIQQDGKGHLICYSHQGIDLDMNDARIWEKHLIIAFENSSVMWIEQNKTDQGINEACVMLRSESDPAIFYVYQHLNKSKLLVRKGQRLNHGDEIGYAWGNGNWGNLHLSVVRSDSVPSYANRFRNLINFFPQLFELYTGSLTPYLKSFNKGSLDFGRNESISGNMKNTLAFEEFSGKGWLLKKWNPADRVESIAKGLQGNARLRKTMYKGTAIACTNPEDYFDFEINVGPGVYRVRAEVGDLEEASWQKIEFEGVTAGIFDLPVNSFRWTSEKVIKVYDGRLTVRIYVSPEKVAGISTLVFQKAY